MQLFAKGVFIAFSFFIVSSLSAQDVRKEPFFVRQIFSNKFVSSRSYITIDGEKADFDKLLKVKDTSILKIEVFDKKVAKLMIGEKEGKYGLIALKTKPYKPLKYPLVTTTDSAQYFIVNSDTIFWKETIPAYIGGDTTNKLWSAFLQKNLDDLVPARHSAPGGLYVVTVSFFVNKDGSISNVQIVHNPGYGTAEEVQRVMAESPTWQAGIYKGQKVKSLKRQTINFAVTEE